MTETNEPDLTASRDAAGLPKDDEREARENIEETGEPERDDLGNQSGAS